MKSLTIPLRVAGIVFGLMCLGQLLRLVTRTEIVIAGYPMPLWASVCGFLVAGGLSMWMWIASFRRHSLASAP